MVVYGKQAYMDNIQFLAPEIKLTILLSGGLNFFKKDGEYNLSWVRRKDFDAAKVWNHGSLVRFEDGKKQEAQAEYYNLVMDLMKQAIFKSDAEFHNRFYKGIDIDTIDNATLCRFSVDSMLSFIRKHYKTHSHLLDHKTVNRLEWWMVSNLLLDVPELKTELASFNWDNPKKRMDRDAIFFAALKIPALLDNTTFVDRFYAECRLNNVNTNIFFMTNILHYLRKNNLVQEGIPHDRLGSFLNYAKIGRKITDARKIDYVEQTFLRHVRPEVFTTLKRVHDALKLKIPVFVQGRSK